MIPKKLDLNFCDSSETSSNLLETENKINELIDYLSDKEEASNYRVVSFSPTGETVPANTPKYKEASKGEEKPCCGRIDGHHGFCKVGQGECSKCNGVDNYGHSSNCEVWHKELAKKYPYHANPPQQEESPKEDEQEWTHDFYETVSKLSILTSDKRIIERYIKANFVSKSKLSKYVQDGIDECNEPGMRIGGVAVLREMQMAFRLEDL